MLQTHLLRIIPRMNVCSMSKGGYDSCPTVRSTKVHYQAGASMSSHYHDEACLVFVQSGSVAPSQGSCKTMLQARNRLYLP